MMPVRIGLVTYGLDRVRTGIGRYTVELARALVDMGGDLEVTLLTAGGPGPLAEVDGLWQASLPGCRLLPGLVTLGNAWIPLRARQLGLDLVHDPAGIAPFLFGAGGARTVVTLHDVFPWSIPGTSTLIETLIYRHWLPRMLSHVDAVLTDSQVSKADIVRYLGVPLSTLHVVPLGVHEAYHPAPQADVAACRSRHALPDSYLLFVGSVERRKNLSGLLRAYARLREMGPCPPPVVVGAKRLGSASIVETLQRLDLEARVIFAGYVPDEDLPALYSGAELFCFPSLYEGFGLPPLEAMACGTPVVCSNAASLPEVVGDAALTVDPTDVEGLAEAMHRVLSDPDLAADLRARGLARASEFTWERTARETVAVYRQVLDPAAYPAEAGHAGPGQQ